MKHVDFFYDFACPYAYLAHRRVDDACSKHGATVSFKPFLLGGVFRAIGTPDRPGDHLRVLEHISRQLRDDAFCKFLKHATTAEEILQLLDEADESKFSG